MVRRTQAQIAADLAVAVANATAIGTTATDAATGTTSTTTTTGTTYTVARTGTTANAIFTTCSNTNIFKYIYCIDYFYTTNLIIVHKCTTNIVLYILCPTITYESKLVIKDYNLAHAKYYMHNSNMRFILPTHVKHNYDTSYKYISLKHKQTILYHLLINRYIFLSIANNTRYLPSQ